ncbi:hypothetical protein ACKWTF_005420 [Chironomus riparius]
MESFDDFTLNFVSISSTFIALYAVLWWCSDHLTSLVDFVVYFCTDYMFYKKGSQSLQEKFGLWAVVTGATDGIGKQYAIELAKKGMNICLISRSETKLIEVANYIEQNHKVITKFIVADFSKGKIIYDKIRTHLDPLDIGILINNVGVMHECPDEFDELSEDSIWEMISVNIGAVTMMTKIIIPKMKLKNRGLVLNVSSGAHCQPMPLAAVYGATKSYTKTFTIALRKELAEYNVKAHLLIPMFVRTKMTDFTTTPKRGNIFFPNAESYVKATINTLGYYSQTCGYWNHNIQYILLNLIPEFVRVFIAHKVNKVFRQQYYNQQKVKQII